MIKFRGKVIKAITATKSFIINTQLLFIWFDRIWKSYEDKKQKQLYFNRLLIVFDVFKADTLGDMNAMLSSYGTNLIMLFPGSTSNYQLLGVCIKKFASGALCTKIGKLPSRSGQAIVK